MSEFRDELAARIAPMCSNSKEYRDWPNLREQMGSRIADAVLALLAERLGGDGVREAIADELLNVGHQPPAPSHAELAFMDAKNATVAALAAIRDHLGVQR